MVLDSTLFYPEGGGQEGDHGHFIQGDVKVNVLDTQKVGDVIVHYTDGALAVGTNVVGHLDWKRRKQLMDHHTAVHIVGEALVALRPHICASSHLRWTADV